MEQGGTENVHPPEGWYPDTTGQQRYWNGEAWTEHVATPVAPVKKPTDSKTLATVMHVSAIFLGFIGPLVVYLVYPDDEFLRDHSRQALNFQITAFIGVLVSIPLAFVLIGIFTMFAIIILALVLHIMGAVAASKGERYDFPLTINFIKS